MSRGPGRIERALRDSLREDPVPYASVARHIYGEDTHHGRQVIGRAANRLATRGEAQLWTIPATTVSTRYSRSYERRQPVKGLSLPLSEQAAEMWALRAFAVWKLQGAEDWVRETNIDVSQTPKPPIGGPTEPRLWGDRPAWRVLAYTFGKPRVELIEARNNYVEALEWWEEIAPPDGPTPNVSLRWALDRLGVLSVYEKHWANLKEMDEALRKAKANPIASRGPISKKVLTESSRAEADLHRTSGREN